MFRSLDRPSFTLESELTHLIPLDNDNNGATGWRLAEVNAEDPPHAAAAADALRWPLRSWLTATEARRASLRDNMT
jgi:hypothetical protein